MHPTDRYIKRHAVHRDWPIDWSRDPAGADVAIVIPAYDEEETLPKALECLARQTHLDRTMVICVVNNPPPDETDPKRIKANQRTLEWLRNHDGLRLGIVDASSPGLELPKREGVGLARRIGMDYAVESFLKSPPDSDGLIVSFDADSTCSENYLDCVIDYFDNNDSRIAVIEYEHPSKGPVADYEIFLRYCVLGLCFTESPYAFHTIGSAMAFRASAYVEVLGMPKKSAAEDFYLLQKLAKVSPMGYIRDAIVYPSARTSDRVPFGTGAAMTQHAQGEREFTYLHDPTVYRILREWLRLAPTASKQSVNSVLDRASAIDSALRDFLVTKGIEKIWPKLQEHAADERRFAKAFHDWFDALATLRCIHHLRDCAYPDVPMEDAVAGLTGRCEKPILDYVRRLQRESWPNEVGP